MPRLRFSLWMVMSVTLTGALTHPVFAGNTLEGQVKVYVKSGQPKIDHANVVVFLDAVEGTHVATAPSSDQVMMASSYDRRFVPEVVPIVVGTTVEFPNEDTIYHNVFSKSKTKIFDLGFYEHGQRRSVTFDQTGLVKVYCDIHSQMVGYILVLNNPYFAVTDATGQYTIREIPDGSYVVRAWQRFGPEQRQTVVLTGGTTSTMTFELTEEKASIEHTNKWDRVYEETYRR